MTVEAEVQAILGAQAMEIAAHRAERKAEAERLRALATCIKSGQVPDECVPKLCEAHAGLAALLRAG